MNAMSDTMARETRNAFRLGDVSDTLTHGEVAVGPF
jgi:hypothetical protein